MPGSRYSCATLPFNALLWLAMSQHELQRNGGHHCQVSSWSNMNKDLPSNIKSLGFIEVHDITVDGDIQPLGNWNRKDSQSHVLPDFNHGHFVSLGESNSVTSVDSGIPTLEIANPEPVHCNVRANCLNGAAGDERVFQSSKNVTSSGTPSLRNCESDHVIWKSSTFPRSGYDTAKLYSPTSLNRSDDISDCSVSSLSTDFSTTLSVSNEDIVDFLVTSNSSAIVNLENDDTHFSDVTLNSAKDNAEATLKGCMPDGAADNKIRILGPISNFFNR
ncbi:LOW QUALITY PROTEIN: TBC1 domain family member 14 [Anomaloglossus baeobatrachus]